MSDKKTPLDERSILLLRQKEKRTGMDTTEIILTAIALPLFAISIALEWWYWQRQGIEKFRTRDSLANYALVLMQQTLGIIGKALFILTALEWVRQHGPLIAPAAWWSVALCFVGVDFGYYWFHRASHRVRFLWAIHVTHHSSELMNFTTALRQPPLEPWVDWLFFIALAWLGYAPKLILTLYAINLMYQFFIHTEVVYKLPKWIELIFNTPSHHRVHHGTNPEYIDMNYAGVLIIWDRLFGTFVEEQAPVKYGILHPVHSDNPLYLAFHLWADIFRDVLKPFPLRVRLQHIFAPPGWPDEYRLQMHKNL